MTATIALTIALEKLYEEVSSGSGVNVEDFPNRLEELKCKRSRKDTEDYRLGRGKWKKLRDEIRPVLCYLDQQGIKNGRIRFPLTNQPPDCLYWGEGETRPIEIEVTIAQGKEKYFLARWLNKDGYAWGFLGLSDDCPDKDFEEAIAKDRDMDSTESVLGAVGGGIKRCLSRKNCQSPLDTLVIEAPLNVLPAERWENIRPDLIETARSSPFKNVYIVDGENAVPGFFIKAAND